MKTATKSKWPGTKNSAGVCEQLISLIPPHKTYIAPFAGHCAIATKMRPAERRVFCDLDRDALAYWMFQKPAELYRQCGIDWLENYFQIHRVDQAYQFRGDVFVFVDPPYFPGTCGKGIYRHELTADDHSRLLNVLCKIPEPVMLAGYRCELYDALLEPDLWERIDYKVSTRGGQKTESVWINYARPTELHDPRFIGRDKRDRERIRKRQRNIKSLVNRLPALERQALLESIQTQ